ncbi:MAG: hypothetical protein RL653_4390 [Pseudomonadota bacterium]|jgi:hypothetical protein
MDSADPSLARARARRAYEWGRLRRAALGALPLLPLVAFSAFLSSRPLPTWCFGLLAFGLGTALLWVGREPQRAVLPGLAAGAVPLVLALCANQVHLCGPDGCSTLCMPACIAGGLAAGAGIAVLGFRRRAGVAWWGGATALTLLTGAMGCSCVGYSGLVGLLCGFAVGVVPLAVKRAVTPAGPAA